jgi:hypothetical protein
MSDKTNNTTLLIIIAVICVMALVTKFYKQNLPKVDSTITLAHAQQVGVDCSPTMAKIYKEVKALQLDGKLDLKISSGPLPNPILGQTSICLGGESESNKIVCSIIIDVEKATLAGDMIEPLLGHELKHVWDALFLFDNTSSYISTAKFIETANDNKKILHHSREVESSAINVENSIRKELLLSGNKIFDNLPKTREAADIVYSNRSKIYPSLKSK